MRGSEQELLSTATRLAAELSRQMDELDIDSLDGPARGNVAEVRRSPRSSGRQSVDLVWRSNGARVPVTANWTAVGALVDAAAHCFTQLERIREGEALGRSLAKRMAAAGADELAAPRGSRLLRLALGGDGSSVWFTWASNRQTFRLHGNAGACCDLWDHARGWERAVVAVERRRQQLDRNLEDQARRGQDALRRHGRGIA